MSRTGLRTLFALIAIVSVHVATASEPVVKERREGDISVIHITTAEGVETVYRVDFSQRHSPATEKTDLIKKWESYRFGAFVCFNSIATSESMSPPTSRSALPERYRGVGGCRLDILVRLTQPSSQVAWASALV